MEYIAESKDEPLEPLSSNWFWKGSSNRPPYYASLAGSKIVNFFTCLPILSSGDKVGESSPSYEGKTIEFILEVLFSSSPLIEALSCTTSPLP